MKRWASLAVISAVSVPVAGPVSASPSTGAAARPVRIVTPVDQSQLPASGSATIVKIAMGPSTGSLTGQRCFR